MPDTPELLDFAVSLVRAAGSIATEAFRRPEVVRRKDAYVNFGGKSRIWDLAAGQAIVEQAGAALSSFPQCQLIAGPPPLHRQLIERLGLK